MRQNTKFFGVKPKTAKMRRSIRLRLKAFKAVQDKKAAKQKHAEKLIHNGCFSMKLKYKLREAGWAKASVGVYNRTLTFDVSYLHDSLKELAQSAIDIGQKKSAAVVFMAEPGEHQLVLSKRGNQTLEYEVRWYEEWASWGMHDENDFEVVGVCETTVDEYVASVKAVLSEIYSTIGVEKYKQLWISHDFPLGEYKSLF